MADTLVLFPGAIDAAAAAFAADPAVDSIVLRVFPDARFPTPPDADPADYAALYRGAYGVVLYGVYADPDVAAMAVLNRRALGASDDDYENLGPVVNPDGSPSDVTLAMFGRAPGGDA